MSKSATREEESLEEHLRRSHPRAPRGDIKLAARMSEAIKPLMNDDGVGLRRESVSLDAEQIAGMFSVLYDAQARLLDPYMPGLARAMSKSARSDALVGMYFHTFEDGPDGGRGAVDLQGRIDAVVDGEIYLATLFDWIAGDQSDRRVMYRNELILGHASFYESAGEMRDAYEAKYRAAVSR